MNFENQIFPIKTVQKETCQFSQFWHLPLLQTEQAPFKLNQWNIHKNPGCWVVNKKHYNYKNLCASLYAKLLCSTKSCQEAMEYSHK